MIPDIRPLLTTLLKPHLKHAEEYGEAKGFVSAAVNIEAMIDRYKAGDGVPMTAEQRHMVIACLTGLVDGLIQISTTVMSEGNPYPQPKPAPRVS